MPTKIEWAQESWNPVTGCTKVSPGCKNCYAERMARRLAGRCGYPEAPHHFDVTLHPERLGQPLRWRKPRAVFVCSMGDLFHEDIPIEEISRIFEVTFQASQHTFLMLTKRPRRALEFYQRAQQLDGWAFGYPNVWLGVTAENQEMADERIPFLLQTPAAVRFVSVEPMLGAVDLSSYLHCGLSWCIIGAESGPRARSMDEDHVRRLVSQCKQAGIAVFYKQKLEKGKKVSLPFLDGKQHIEFPQTIDKRNVN